MLLQPRPKVMYSKYDKHLSYALAHKMSAVHFSLFWIKKGVFLKKKLFFMLINNSFVRMLQCTLAVKMFGAGGLFKK